MKIYISSTFRDLHAHRAAVDRNLRSMGHDVIGMEQYVAEGGRPLQRCLADVEAADVYVLLLGWRSGYRPTECNPNRLSITELEFQHAKRLTTKPILAFLLEPRDALATERHGFGVGGHRRGRRHHPISGGRGGRLPRRDVHNSRRPGQSGQCRRGGPRPDQSAGREATEPVIREGGPNGGLRNGKPAVGHPYPGDQADGSSTSAGTAHWSFTSAMATGGGLPGCSCSRTY